MADFQDMWSYLYMVNAFRAGLIVAVVCAVVGWFMVLRRQTFAGHTLSVAAFPGAALAVLAGFSTTLGYFGFCIAAALVIAALNRKGREAGGEESAVTGTVQAFALACGFLFISLYKGLLEGPTALLFGDFLGITTGQVVTLAMVGAVVLAVLAVIGRPLLFATLDEAVAAARGVPVRLLGFGFLALVGATAGEATQAVGSLLLLGLLAAPAGAAIRLTDRPFRALALSAALAVGEMWGGLLLSAAAPKLPPSFAIMATASAVYAATFLIRPARAARPVPA
ncbi:metal ABC transporter permease [Kitasatospora sp. NPDC057904]|uniref:metal ABC transporter permease n=1 Tax=unclassified Kitasatospora TaxID=2633591 RepID=UPI0036DF49A1